MRPNFPNRPAPVRERLLALLRKHDRPTGISTVEVAQRLGARTTNVNNYLCKLHLWGLVHKISERPGGRSPHELNKWRLPK